MPNILFVPKDIDAFEYPPGKILKYFQEEFKSCASCDGCYQMETLPSAAAALARIEDLDKPHVNHMVLDFSFPLWDFHHASAAVRDQFARASKEEGISYQRSLEGIKVIKKALKRMEAGKNIKLHLVYNASGTNSFLYLFKRHTSSLIKNDALGDLKICSPKEMAPPPEPGVRR